MDGLSVLVEGEPDAGGLAGGRKDGTESVSGDCVAPFPFFAASPKTDELSSLDEEDVGNLVPAVRVVDNVSESGIDPAGSQLSEETVSRRRAWSSVGPKRGGKSKG